MMDRSLCLKDVCPVWSVVTLNAGRVAMHGNKYGNKILVYGMIIAATADVLTAVACWFIVFLL